MTTVNNNIPVSHFNKTKVAFLHQCAPSSACLWLYRSFSADANTHSLSVILVCKKRTHFVKMVHSQLAGCGFARSLFSTVPVVPDLMDLILKGIQHRSLESQSHNHNSSMWQMWRLSITASHHWVYCSISLHMVIHKVTNAALWSREQNTDPLYWMSSCCQLAEDSICLCEFLMGVIDVRQHGFSLALLMFLKALFVSG